MNKKPGPPKLPLRFFRWYCHPDYQEDIEGDLMERFERRIRKKDLRSARWRFTKDVMKLFRPGIIRPVEGYEKLNNYGMIKSYFTTGWRNLIQNKGYSLINIGGLSLGIAVTLLIGLWVFDELSYNIHYPHHNHIATVLQNNTIDNRVQTSASQSFQLGPELRNNYGNYFDHVVMSSFPVSSILAHEEKTFIADGDFMEPEAPELLSLKMLYGTRNGLQDPSSILLSSSVARKFFGNEDPVGKVIKIDNETDLKITGVYKDLPDNDSFKNELSFIAPLEVLISRGGRYLGWGNNWLQVFVKVAENVDMDQASEAIRDAKLKNIGENEFGAGFNPQLFLHPMNKWHLYSGFKNGVNTGGRIQFVWLFGAIGMFVILLACINFMNLSTARSQKRAKEVGVRKVIGSGRSQLIGQFFSESLLVVSLAFVFGILLARLFLSSFNHIADKNIDIPLANPFFWLLIIAFIFLIAMISGSYPAFYLSAFKPVSVLKGTFRTGRRASLPRKVLVIIQFTVSVTLLIGTIIVYQQIQYARNRPIGYDLNGLVTIPMKTDEVKKNYETLRNELLASGVISEVSTSETTVTNLWWSDSGFEWPGKDPNMQDHIYRGAISHEFGKTVGWRIKEGRDFSRDFLSDSSAMILNEAAVKYMGLEDPVGAGIRAYGRNYTVIGVVEDMLTQSLYRPVKQTIFIITPISAAEFINVKINPQSGASIALEELNSIFVKHNPGTPFEYTFADDEFARKFSFEQRMGKLVGIFTLLAVVISCLGLFGLASFMAEQRSKEIGIRKVTGASVFSIWKMLSKDFAFLVLIAVLISIPVGYFLMDSWLRDYEYRMEITWWIFAASALGALAITLLTVSYQSVKAALANPVDSLRSE